MMDFKIELFASVIASDAFPARGLGTGSEFVRELGLWDVVDFAMVLESMTEFSVFTVKEKPFVKTLKGFHHEAGAHDLGDSNRLCALFDESGGVPIGR